MNISIFGLGYVGCVSLGCLAKNGHTVIGVDVNKTKVDQINSGIATIVEKEIDEIIKTQFHLGKIRATLNHEEAVINSEISIVCVGTPSSVNGHLNLNYILEVACQIGEAIAKIDSFHIVAVRSTILPGTIDKIGDLIEEKSSKKKNIDFAVLSNPEFLREGSAVYDYYNPPFTLIGSDNSKAAEKLSSLYKELLAEIIITDIKVAEIIKYINNTFHALKISFANEVGSICQKLNIDPFKVMDIFIKDKQLNISPYYFKPGFAYGGSCLPKDLKGLQTLAHDLYLNVPVIESIHKTNELQINKAVELIINLNKKKIGFLGLSFKAGTDDLRNSPAVILIETLLGKGYDIKIFDDNVQQSRLLGKNKEFIDIHIPHLSNLFVEKAADIIDFSDIIIIATKEKLFKEILCEASNNKIIIDLVRLDEELLKKENYFGINW